MDSFLKNMPVDVDQLKNNINSYVENLVDEYIKNKSLLFIQSFCEQNKLNYNEILLQYNDFFNTSSLNNSTCKGLTKNGAHCTHKCSPGALFCKKHSKSQPVTTVQSFFPESV